MFRFFLKKETLITKIGVKAMIFTCFILNEDLELIVINNHNQKSDETIKILQIIEPKIPGKKVNRFFFDLRLECLNGIDIVRILTHMYT